MLANFVSVDILSIYVMVIMLMCYQFISAQLANQGESQGIYQIVSTHTYNVRLEPLSTYHTYMYNITVRQLHSSVLSTTNVCCSVSFALV